MAFVNSAFGGVHHAFGIYVCGCKTVSHTLVPLSSSPAYKLTVRCRKESLTNASSITALFTFVFCAYYMVACPLLAILVFRVARTITLEPRHTSSGGSSRLPKLSFVTPSLSTDTGKTDPGSVTVLSIHNRELEELPLPAAAYHRIS